MTEENKTYATNYRVITLKTSDGSTVRGKVNVAPNQRVSEIFTAQQGPFVVVVDASYGHVTDKTLFINKDHIVWVEPED
jgi:hypothetical protein